MLTNKQAFTLIELLVVVLILGILAAVAVPQYQRAVDKARVSELFALVKNLKEQQEVFYLANGYYAADCNELGADMPGGFEKVEDSDNYHFHKGSYTISLDCNNGDNNADRIRGTIVGSGFDTAIEAFLEHYSDDDVVKGYRGHQGKIFCSAPMKDSRSLNVCKSLGKEERTGKSWWL